MNKTTYGPIRVCALCSRFYLVTALIALFKDAHQAEVMVCEECARKVSDALTLHKGQRSVTDEMCHTEFAGLEMLRPLYTEIRNPEKVKQILQTNPYLMGALLESPAQIKKFFPDEEIILEPSVSLDVHSLLICVQSTRNAEVANTILDQLDNEWWFVSVPEKVREMVCVVLDCEP